MNNLKKTQNIGNNTTDGKKILAKLLRADRVEEPSKIKFEKNLDN